MQKILISVFMTILATGIYAQYNTDDPYYFLYQTAKETYINTTNIDSTDQLFRNAILQDLNFFENNRMWEAGYYYLSSFYPEESESFDAEPLVSFTDSTPVITEDKASGIHNTISVESGIDYSSQDFELLGFDSDTLISERISTPNYGLRWQTGWQNQNFQLEHSLLLKNDKNYFTANGSILLNLNFYFLERLFLNYDRLADHQQTTYSFFQHEAGLELGKETGHWDWHFTGNFRYKHYDAENEYLKNYLYQNYNLLTLGNFTDLDIAFNINLLSLKRIQSQEFDREVSINTDLDYFHPRFEFRLYPEIRHYQYQHIINDTVEQNNNTDYVLNNEIKIPINTSWNLCNYSEIIFRSYLHQTDIENNFIYFKLKPGLEYELSKSWSIKLSGISEKEKHLSDIALYQIDDFTSFGIGLDVQMLFPKQFFVLQYEFIHRQNSNFLSSISSFNHPANVHNINLSANINISKNISVNGIINYDYDKNWKEGNLNTSQLVSLQLIYKLL